MVAIGWPGAAPHTGEIQAYIPYLTLPYFTFFVTGPIDQTAEPMFMRSGSNNTVLPKEVPFWGLIKRNFH
jgi:hypothetical protein